MDVKSLGARNPPIGRGVGMLDRVRLRPEAPNYPNTPEGVKTRLASGRALMP